MSLLAQQELVEVPPSRRIIVPVGASAWWGVDPGTSRVAVATVRPVDGGWARAVRSVSFASLEGGQRLSAIYADTRQLAFELAMMAVPGLVLVEQPSGKQANPALSYAVGVVQAGLYDGVRDAAARPVEVRTVSSSWWKKRACGRGDIYKPKAASGQEYGVLVWARENGYGGSLWDEADAWGIAEAGRREWQLEER